MNLSRTFGLLAQEIRMSPRSGVFLMALLVPALLTLLVQLVFGSLFEPSPRLAIVDEGNSALVDAARARDGLRVTLLDDAAVMRERVEAHDFDAGLVLAADFDEALRAGARPELGFVLSGESLAVDRIVLAVATLDLVRGLDGTSAPVEIIESFVGPAPSLPLADRLLPLLVFYALMISSLVVPSFRLVEERERGTLAAVLVTPVRLSEVMLAKSAFGIVLGMAMTLLTLALNGFPAWHGGGLLVVLLIAAMMCSEIGMIYAVFSKNVPALYIFVKGLGVVLFAPMLWYVFPTWPAWGAKLFPTWWIIDPIFEMAVRGTPLVDLLGTLAGALAICLLLGVLLVWGARRMQESIATG